MGHRETLVERISVVICSLNSSVILTPHLVSDRNDYISLEVRKTDLKKFCSSFSWSVRT